MPEVPLLLVIFLFACVIGVVLALITLSLQRISRRVIEQYRDKIDDANLIVNGGRPPARWVEPFRQRIERPPRTLGRGANGEASVDRIGEQARQHCLKRLKNLIAFMEKGQFYDGEETRDMVVKTLRSEYERWTSCYWAELVLGNGGEGREG